MLHPVAHLLQHIVRHIEGILGDEINANALGADELHGLLNFLHEARGRIVKQQMSLIEEENQLGFFRIAHFRHFLKQLREEPEEECGVELRRGHEPVGGEDVHVATAVARGAHQILDVEGWLAKEFVAALFFDHHKPALDGADGGGLHIAILGGDFLAAIGEIGQQGAQVLEIKQPEVFIVGKAEGNVERPLLCFREAHKARQHEGTHFGDCGADGMALLAEEIPEDCGRGFHAIIVEADFFGALGKGFERRSDLRNAGEIAFHIGGKNRDARLAETLGHDLQGDGLARAGGAGYQPVAIGQWQEQLFALVAFAQENCVVTHAFPPSKWRPDLVPHLPNPRAN